jgi:Yqey-like protein
MAQLLARLQTDLNSARKAQDKARVTLLGTIISDIKNREIELKRDATDDDVNDMLRRGIKRRRESIEMYDKGNRADLAAIERSEVDALSAYLPVGVSDDRGRRRERWCGDGQGHVPVQGTRGGRDDQRHRPRGAGGANVAALLRSSATTFLEAEAEG